MLYFETKIHLKHILDSKEEFENTSEMMDKGTLIHGMHTFFLLIFL